MVALSLDFRRIREHQGTQNGGFEELCCQLAALEAPAKGSRFIRKGPGADQGLECYRTFSDGNEVGWQAKYFINGFGDTQIGDLRDSLQRALSAHPQLTTFIVCLPIDLRDNRQGKRLSEVQRYEKWCTKSIEDAAANGRTVEIVLWSASSISERLGRDDSAYSGRARYWFDTVWLSSTWFRDKLEVQRRNLGERYSPESHVELPIQQALQSLARDPELLSAPAAWAAEITHKLDGAVSSLLREKLLSTADRLRQACELFLLGLSAPPVTLEASVPLEAWTTQAAAASDSLSEAMTEVEDKVLEGNRHIARKDLFVLYSAVDRVRQEIASVHWRLMNKRELVISGPGGIGKSHLIADFGHKQLKDGRPFVLVLSGTLTEGDPWEQIRGQLDLAQVTTADFLGALDAAAEAAGSRAVLAIDALNERNGVALWEPRLLGFISRVQQYPRLALVLTIRSTYLHFLPVNGLEHIVHPGFAGHANAAAKTYLDRRGIVRPNSPNLAREFENPLFLRTCCAYLDAENLKQLPKGMDGVTAIFEFYLTAVAKKVEKDLQLIPQLKIPRKALEQFLEACAAHGDGGILPMEESIELMEGLHNSGGYAGRSLFTAFLSEGVLTQDIEWQPGGVHKDIIRFTFERLSDHLRAKLLIDQIDRANIEGSFRRAPLKAYFEPFESWQFAGVIEALAVQLPEEFGLELFDVLPEEAIEDQSLCDAFEGSLAWRSPKAFTSRTTGWVNKLCEATGRSAYGLILLVCTEPENQFNADWLHHDLWPRPMPQRDAIWSVFLAQDDLSEGGSVGSLIDWAWQVDANEVDEQRLRLAAVALTWFLSASNRAVRDRATKALVNLLSCNLNHAATLVHQFADVDDQYIIERLLAACYGAVMQGMDRTHCGVLAASIWKNYFADHRQPPLNLLARDYAFGVLRYVQAAGRLPSEVVLEACKNKFKSAWPLEPVTEKDLEKYSGKRYGDSICSSTDKHGDFGNYTLRSWLHDIVAVPRTLAGNTTKELYESWEDTLIEKGNNAQLAAYFTLRQLSVDYRQRPDEWLSNKGNEESKRLLAAMEQANEAFKVLLTSEILSEYTAFAEQHLFESARMNNDNPRPPHIDHSTVRRWICERAHQLGWSEELFEAFERSRYISHDRMGNHRVERIGKKYQYIALSEVTARMTDNLAMFSYEDDGMLRAFELGPRDRDMKTDLDPSLLVRSTLESGGAPTPITWWTPSAPRLPAGDTDLLLAWVCVESDLCNDVGQVEIASPDGLRWLTVYGFRRWTVPGQSRRNHADTWSRISCFVTALGSGPQLAQELLGDHRGDADHVWEQRYLESFLGEHGWRDARDIKLKKRSRAGIKTPYAGIVESLNAERSGKDNSIDDGFTLCLPSSGVIKALDLHLCSGKAPEYVDDNGTLRWQDPSLRMRGASAGVVSHEYFLEKLASAGLEPVWVLAGEKNVYSGQDVGISSGGFGGSLYHTTTFAMDAGALKSFGTRTEFHAPNADQLKKFKAQ